MAPEEGNPGDRNQLDRLAGFLLARRVVSWEDLEQVFRLQVQMDKRFGQLAMVRGYIAPRDVLATVASQTDTDLPFGKIALSKGLMSEKQVREILALQGDQFRLFVEAVRQRQPQVRRVYYTSIKPCPRLLRLWPRQQGTNELIRQYCQTHPDARFVPYFQTVLTEDGSIRPEAFRPDEVPLAPAHYGEVAKLLRPLLARDWAAASSSST